MQILWFKRDLRVVHNAALIEAMKGVAQYGKILCLYIHEPEMLALPSYSLRHQIFVRECLDSLAEDLISCGGQLVELIGKPSEVLEKIGKQHPIVRIVSHQEVTDSYGYARDREVRRWAKDQSIGTLEVDQNNIDRQGNRLEDFATWFSRHSQGKIRDPRGVSLSSYFHQSPPRSCDRKDIPVSAGSACVNPQRGGRAEADKVIERFFRAESIIEYQFSISSPNTAFEGCSRLSPYLAWGVIGQEEVAWRLNQLVSEAVLSNHPKAQLIERGCRFALDRYGWRQGFHSMAARYALDVEEFFEGFGTTDQDSADYEHRKDLMVHAKTGIPWIDASLICLQKTGYAPFRTRSCLANWLCLGLDLHWSDVGNHLASLFLDFDGGAIHWNQIRIASASGPSEGMLIYSPSKQNMDHDKDCVWVKEHLPALKEVPNQMIYRPWEYSSEDFAKFSVQLGVDYPVPYGNADKLAQEGKQRAYRARKPQALVGGPVDSKDSRRSQNGDQMKLF